MNYPPKAKRLELQLETTAHCNAACVFCPYPTLKRKGTMSMGLFERIIDDMAGIPTINSIVLHGLGDPTLDPHMEDRLKYIYQVKKLDIPSEMYTNGIGMVPRKIDAFKNAGLTCMVFSVNAVRSEQHDAIMGTKGKFEQVCANADYARSVGLNVETHAVLTGDTFTLDDLLAFYKRWGRAGMGGVGVVIHENNWAGMSRSTREWNANTCCSRAIAQIYVLVDGRVAMCCYDPSGNTTFGDLSKQSIREVYNSDYYTMFREMHAMNRAAVFERCAGCTRT